MQHKKRKTFTYIRRVLLGLFFLFAIFALVVFQNGYNRYKTTLEEKPIQVTISTLQENPNYTSLTSVSENFLSPLLAVEDPEFYEHHGYRIENIMEAAIQNILARDVVMGGSTITQQVSKNLFLDQKQEFNRKIAEVFIANDLENTYSKREILEFYINSGYFGDGYYGIQEASMGYFGVDPSQLSLAQGTMLAGLLQAPSSYQLSTNFDLARKRQRVVLDEMIEQGIITTKQADDIYSVSLVP